MISETPPGNFREEPVSAQHGAEPALKHYLAVLSQYLWVVVGTVIIALTWGTFQAFKAIPIYEAVAKISIGGDSFPISLLRLDEMYSFNPWQINFVDTQVEVIKSRLVLEKTLEQPEVRALFDAGIPAEEEPTFGGQIKRTALSLLGIRPKVIRRPIDVIQQAIQVDQLEGKQIILVKVRSASPEWAAKVANGVARAYEQYQIESREQSNKSAFRFLQEQRDKTEQKLREAEDALQKAREQAKMLTLDITDKNNPILSRLNRLNEQLTQVQLDRIDLEAQYAILREVTTQGKPVLQSQNERLFSLPAVQSDKMLSELRAELFAVEKEIAVLMNTAGPQNPQVQAAETKRSMIQDKLHSLLTPMLSALAVQLDLLRNREKELQRNYDIQNQMALDLAKQSTQYQRLEREVERQSKIFEVLVDRLRDASLTADYTGSTVRVLEPATVPETPIAPNKFRWVISYGFLGVFLGIGLAFFFNYLDDTVKTPDEIEQRLGVPVLGFVPEIECNGQRKDGLAHRALVAQREPHSAAAEAYRNIRTNLFFSGPEERNRVLTFTSTVRSDGKTTTACNLSVVMAQGGKRVLLLDADLRKPMVHKVFGLDDKVGLSSILTGQIGLDQAVQKVVKDGKVVPNLDVVCAGPKPPNPAELLNSIAMQELLEAAKKKYDRVIIDTPPILYITDASIVGALSDGVIMIVKSAKTTRSLLRRSFGQLAAVNARIVGTVLNHVRPSRLGYYPYYYYHYYRYYPYDGRKNSRPDKPEEAGKKNEVSD